MPQNITVIDDMPRRFPPPWSAEPIAGGYVVKDRTGQALAYVYASNIAKLPEFLKR